MTLNLNVFILRLKKFTKLFSIGVTVIATFIIWYD